VNCEPNETDILGNEANTVDFNKFYEKLEKLPKIGIKSYLGKVTYFFKILSDIFVLKK